MLEVVAALIWQETNFDLPAVAPQAQRALWEFAGGKVEPGETKEQALIRECQEELAVTVSVQNVFMEVTHPYPDITVHLTLFNARIESGTLQRKEHADLQWITPSQIDQYVFCPADEPILEALKAASSHPESKK